MNAPTVLYRGQHPDHRTARADRFWRHAVGFYGLALFITTSVIQLCGAR